MKHFLFFSTFLLILCVCCSAPADNKDTNNSKSAFGPAFDEIVVESSLTVRRKSPDGRSGRTQNSTEPSTRTKRQGHHHGFDASAANAQAQAFNNFGPLGSFGASATGTQTQAFSAGPKGLAASGGFSGTQQYNFNGQTVDIAFGNTFSGADRQGAQANGAAITITGPDGKKRPLQG